MVEDPSDLSGADQGSQAAGVPSVAALQPDPIDVEALVQTAVRRIADAMTPVTVLVPAQEAKPRAPEPHVVDAAVAEPKPELDLPDSEEPEPAEPALNDAPVVSRSPDPVSEIVDVEAVVEPAAFPAEAESGPSVVADLGYVPRGEDRILPLPQTPVVPQRIEPTFEAAPASIAAEPPTAKLALSSEMFAFLRGPWTVRRVARLAGLAVAAYFGVILF